ncbi:MAG: geranylgeranylglycerol-phosphate geranylgeranyltransferase [Candidatus Verstraetearchaeota archaeon]|nr:geranylgeranylglycerol-phosphate geranylgeranyltransferase [Candidatus Verstraetearchaeota archaeon]
MAVIIGEVAVLGNVPPFYEMVAGFLVSFFLTTSSMAMNDYVDLEIDMINQPSRPLPSGAIPKQVALYLAGLTGFLGILAAVPFDWGATALAIVTFAMSTLYNLYGKRTGFWGNLMVSYCVAVPFLFGGIMVMQKVNATSLTFFLLAFLANAGREVTKGIADMEGDRVRAIKTVALVRGARSAAFLSALLYLIPAAISPLPYVSGQLGNAYLALIIPVDLGFVYSSYLITKNYEQSTALRVKTQVRYWMLLGLLAFFFGGLLR